MEMMPIQPWEDYFDEVNRDTWKSFVEISAQAVPKEDLMTHPPSTLPEGTRPVPPRDDASGVRQTLRALARGGWKVTHLEYSDGDRESIPHLCLEDELIELIMGVDDMFVHVVHVAADGQPDEPTWVYFVFGNSPEEVICNHTLNLSPVLDPLMKKWTGV